ncbi:hypothetical protein PVAP13_3NG205450 [Panicum virgatum]|uniref:Uncharacterized protein n=1 Tax=Panicum virgatum TaxID=38727 RepID=A0A8T0UJ65_PANVG|nr:hypothetical protein PVAP13_3NG205450 [Panicum virgatum]
MGLLAPSTQALGLLACSGAVQYTTGIYGLFLVRVGFICAAVVLLVLSNICSFASGIKLLLVLGAWIFGAVGPAGVYFRLLYLFSM